MKASKNSRTTTPEGTQPKPELTVSDNNTASKPARISYAKWCEKYRPLKNPFDNAAPYDGCLIENYGAILRRIGVTHSRRIWALVQCENEHRILDGFHYVNCLGHFVTEVEAPANRTFSIKAD